MRVAVEETATATGGRTCETASSRRELQRVIFLLRQLVSAAPVLAGALPSLSDAQIVRHSDA
jgi:hypothetical protein